MFAWFKKRTKNPSPISIKDNPEMNSDDPSEHPMPTDDDWIFHAMTAKPNSASFMENIFSRGRVGVYGTASVTDSAKPSEPAEPLRPLPEVIKIVKPGLTTSLGQCVFNDAANTLTIEVAPWVVEWSINEGNFRRLIKNNDELTLPRITARIETDPLLIPACKWLVPSESQVRLGGVLPDDWPYIRANKITQCSNPAVVSPQKYDICHHFPETPNCNQYSAAPNESLATASADDEIIVRLVKKPYACQIPRYQVSTEAISSTYTNYDEALGMFNEIVDETKKTLEVTVATPGPKEKNSYLESVLTETV
jgi:hypothetical protein